MSKMFRLSSVWNLPLQRKGLYGPLEADMKELPHPSRNLTVSRVVIMVRMSHEPYVVLLFFKPCSNHCGGQYILVCHGFIQPMRVRESILLHIWFSAPSNHQVGVIWYITC